MAEDALPASARDLGTVLAETRRRLNAAGLGEAALDARLIVEHFSMTQRIDALRDPALLLDARTVAAIMAAVERRLAGTPVHRILGYRDFYGLRLALSPETLEPRPDTETLVEAVLAELAGVVARKRDCAILDLGTGTGAIALALLAALPQARACGVDLSAEAARTAIGNATRLGMDGRFTAHVSNWFRDVTGVFDAIVSNPPYITSREMRELPVEVAGHDPHLALDGGADGLDAYRVIAAGAGAHLDRDGVVGVEIGSRQKTDVVAVFAAHGFSLRSAARDLAGHDRALVFGL
ncbi:peptide chain release factor N(5)-glutamine methyltransferase [Nitratireductor alexandrii]|uniref:peptide chain release factor N(5)-glutamine methyltransferase n=1 Tax=Nitratireductor alexandrii TaxID=2448161 RepID=UPI000FDC55F8|nr:peptide chain release factor N(5)-glutamine methyltransferase [Nitratireductor alexandrii]